LLESARTLRAAGWKVFVTMTGISFCVPISDECDLNFGDEEAEQLQRLGIVEKCEFASGRTLPEIITALDELFERVWYERADRNNPKHSVVPLPESLAVLSL